MAEEQKNGQDTKQKIEQKKRNPYADLGLMIAVTLIIVTILRCLIFGISWEDSFFFIIAAAYCLVSRKYDSESKFIKNSTTGLLLTTVIALVTIIIVDRKPQPKMHAFEGAQADTVKKEKFIIKDEPIIYVADSDTTAVSDSLTSVEVDPEAPVEEGTEETQPAEETEESTEDNI